MNVGDGENTLYSNMRDWPHSICGIKIQSCGAWLESDGWH